jgi:hypothetical protein
MMMNAWPCHVVVKRSLLLFRVYSWIYLQWYQSLNKKKKCAYKFQILHEIRNTGKQVVNLQIRCWMQLKTIFCGKRHSQMR